MFLFRIMVVWPKYLGKTKENMDKSQSSETFCQLPFSPSPVELQVDQPETELELLQNDRMVHYCLCISNIAHYCTEQCVRDLWHI